MCCMKAEADIDCCCSVVFELEENHGIKIN